ncbi:MAG TPA: hypothetical protein VFV50_16765 [Bdellovibrionales bacterium]|nr:hypothetical protein [Bdellovibrionales bacterium]
MPAAGSYGVGVSLSVRETPDRIVCKLSWGTYLVLAVGLGAMIPVLTGVLYANRSEMPSIIYYGGMMLLAGGSVGWLRFVIFNSWFEVARGAQSITVFRSVPKRVQRRISRDQMSALELREDVYYSDSVPHQNYLLYLKLSDGEEFCLAISDDKDTVHRLFERMKQALSL